MIILVLNYKFPVRLIAKAFDMLEIHDYISIRSDIKTKVEF